VQILKNNTKNLFYKGIGALVPYKTPLRVVFILRKFLGWHNLIRHACQFKLQNVQRIIYQDLSGNKFETVFLAISRISAGVHERFSSIFVFCDRTWIKQKTTLKT
jgi:hypothetical protein